MCTLEDAWGTMSSQQRQSFGAAPDKPYARFGQLVEKPGHFSCNGSFVTEPTGVQAVATPQTPQIIYVPEREKKRKKKDRERQVIVVEEPCGKNCPHCRHGSEQLKWWHWLLAIVGTALLAALFVRLFQPNSRTIYRQIGIKI